MSQWLELFPSIPLVTKYATRNDWEEAVWTIMTEHLAHAAVGNEIRKILEAVTTPAERHCVILRLAALHRLAHGVSYRTIGKELWLSPQTTSSLVKAARTKLYRSYYDRGKTERKRKQYSSNQKTKKPRPHGWARKTKYGTIYMRGF